MDFGRVDPRELKNIDFTLPPDRPETKAVLKGKPIKSAKVHVGCAKWGRPEWIGKLYPKGTKEADFLQEYAKHFNCIEFNAMFYRIFSKAAIENWVNKVGKEFIFCPKFNNSITHIQRLKNAEEATGNFLSAISNFGKHLGPCFLQLSDNFGPKNFDLLKAYLQSLPKDLEVFIEVRHKDWYTKGNAALLFGMLNEEDFGSVITDAAGRRDCAHMALTTPKAFIRFVGNSLHETDFERIDDWAIRIKKWMDEGIKEVYFFIHMHDEKYSPELAAYTVDQFNKVCKLHLPEVKIINSKQLF
jgi:uncharacterized protein YecE (DUF72 family)